MELDDLSVLGHVHVLKLKYEPEGYDRKLVAELWKTALEFFAGG